MTSGRRFRATLTGLALVAGAAGTLYAPTTAAADPHVSVDPNASVAYQGNPAHDGDSSDPSFIAPLTKAWSTTLDGTVGYPVVAGGRVFVAVARDVGHGNEVEALSLATGEPEWGPVAIGGTYSAVSIAYDRGQVFAINFDGRLTAMDASSGAVNWTTQLAGQYSFTSPPTAVNGTVYVGGAGSGGTLYAVDEATGSTTWTARVENGDSSSPAVDDSGVYVSYACEQAYKFGLTGTLSWHHSTGCEGGGGRTAVLHSGRVYIRDDAGMAPAVLDAATGHLSATFDSDPVPAFDGRRMVTVTDGVVTVSDTLTGRRLWRTSNEDVVTAPLIANGYVIEGLPSGKVEARLLQSGQLVWSGQAGAPLEAPDEHSAGILTGLAQGDGALVVPAGSSLTVFKPAGDTTVTFGSAPADDTFVKGSTRFTFHSGVANADYVCTLDGTAQPCTSPVRLSNLSQGRHHFSVAVAYAIDGAAARTFDVDTSAPTAEVEPFSPALIDARHATARWSGTDTGSGVHTYQVRTRRSPVGSAAPSWSGRDATTSTSASLHIRHQWTLCVSVRAEDLVGNSSAWSPAQCVTRR